MLQARFLRQIRPSDIQICLREDGTEWLLGSGSFGEVRSQRAESLRVLFYCWPSEYAVFVLAPHAHADYPPCSPLGASVLTF